MRGQSSSSPSCGRCHSAGKAPVNAGRRSVARAAAVAVGELGHGDCVELAPTAIALEDTAVVIGAAPYEQLLAAAQACPAVAIALVDEATGEQAFP